MRKNELDLRLIWGFTHGSCCSTSGGSYMRSSLYL
jgi:hypothetical protein